jgi:hypothetical protein
MKKFLPGLIIFIFLFSGCSQDRITSSPITPLVSPQPDKTIVVGRIVSPGDKSPYANLIVRLAEIHHEENGQGGVFVMDEGLSPGTRTDNNGNFVIEDVPPMEYAIVVGYSSGQYVVIRKKNGDVQIWLAEAGKILDVGVLEIELNR